MPFFINLLKSIENVMLVMAVASLVMLILIFQVGKRFSGVISTRSANNAAPS
jgi:hypothetical protein